MSGVAGLVGATGASRRKMLVAKSMSQVIGRQGGMVRKKRDGGLGVMSARATYAGKQKGDLPHSPYTAFIRSYIRQTVYSVIVKLTGLNFKLVSALFGCSFDLWG